MSSGGDIDRVTDQRTHGRPGRVVASPEAWVLAFTLALALVLAAVTDTFDTPQNLFNVTRNFAFVAIIALGMTAVIVSGGIDLSVGSVLCLSAMVLAIVMNGGAPLWVGVAAALGTSLLVGAVNGVLIAYVGIPPFVVTLGMLSVARSAAMVLSNNSMIYEFGPDQDLLFALGGGATLGVPNPVIALAALAVVMAFALRWTRWGARVFGLGSNERAVALCGVDTRRLKASVYMVSALMAGTAGVLEAGWLGGVTTNLGQSMELSVIAAAVIGGANLMGGAGTVTGAIVGAALIEIVRNSLTLLGVSTFWQGAFVGGFIIAAVAVDRLRARRED